MAHPDDRPDERPDGPSLAPPKIGFGLRRRKKPADPVDPVDPVEADPEPQTVVDLEPVASEAPAPAPDPGPVVAAAPPQAPQAPQAPARTRPPTIFDVRPGATAHPATEPAPDPEPVIQPEPGPAPVPEPGPTPVPEPEDAATFIPGLTDTAPTAPPHPAEPTDDQPAAPADVPETQPIRVVGPAEPETSPETEAVATPPATGAVNRLPRAPRPARPPREPRPPRPPRELDLPSWLVGPVAAALIGLVVGLAIVIGTAVVLQGCELVRGTASCGGGPGFVFLVLVVAAGVLLGSALLRLVGSDGALSTSLLALGVMAVVVMVFFIGQVFAWWMVVLVPLLCAATFAASQWASSTFTDVQTD